MSAVPYAPPDPRISDALGHVHEALATLKALPDDGSLWKAKLALLDAVQHLVRVRRGEP